MRSSLICVAMVVAAAPAAASPEREVEALVRTTVDHVADASSAAGFAKGATVIGIHANVFDFDSGKITVGEHDEAPIDFASHGKLWPMLFGKEAPSGTRKLCWTEIDAVKPINNRAKMINGPPTAEKSVVRASALC